MDSKSDNSPILYYINHSHFVYILNFATFVGFSVTPA